MRVAVDAGRRPVGRPPRVGDAGVRVEHLGRVDARVVDELLELGNLAYFLEREHLVLLVAVDGQAGRVVPSVLETIESW